MTNGTVGRILSDPTFNVEEFVHNVRLHSNYPIMDTLIEDPYIILSIAEGDDYEVLPHHPPKTAEIYEKMEEMGFEIWMKVTRNSSNWWRGVIINDELALLGKQVRHTTCKVFRGKDAATHARKCFKRLKMHMKGTKPMIAMHGNRPVDYIRAIVAKTIKNLTGSKQNYDCAQASFFFQMPTKQYVYKYSNNPVNLHYKVIARGHSVQVAIKVYYANAENWNYSWVNTKISMVKDPKAKKKEFKQAKEVADEIVLFLRNNNTELDKALSKVII